MGTAYLADKIREFGDLHLVLASYNAGERPVHRWTSERSGLAHDEFIDDIPFPETQNYVKKILGTAEDYRRLYGPPSADSVDDERAEPAAPASAVAAPPPAGTKVTPTPAKKRPASQKRTRTRAPRRM